MQDAEQISVDEPALDLSGVIVVPNIHTVALLRRTAKQRHVRKDSGNVSSFNKLISSFIIGIEQFSEQRNTGRFDCFFVKRNIPERCCTHPSIIVNHCQRQHNTFRHSPTGLLLSSGLYPCDHGYLLLQCHK
ncbi:hypothetical protein NX059_010593 [Plenodomus lindquistii]|nr:hypothetical protein NX059_010593 [Plenodomus lindquistii]